MWWLLIWCCNGALGELAIWSRRMPTHNYKLLLHACNSNLHGCMLHQMAKLSSAVLLGGLATLLFNAINKEVALKTVHV